MPLRALADGAGQSIVWRLGQALAEYDYIKDPDEIYRRSFATVEAEADLDRFDARQRQVVKRLIHTCGLVELAERVAISNQALEAGITALQASKPIISDVAMVQAGITQAITNRCPRVCTLNDPNVPELATTRSARAVELWQPHLAGAIVAIGNAPTALFHLLERLEAGWPKPGLVVAMPVGFVGAAESKDALIAAEDLGLDYITVTGRMGGSALAAAAVNALGFLAASC